MPEPQRISIPDALEIILKSVPQMGSESIPLGEALGRTLFEDAVASSNLPAFDNSAMDGYAVRSEDLAGASSEKPVKLVIAGESSAGAPFVSEVKSGTAVRIMTGAVIPDGADAVIEVEMTREEGGTVVALTSITRGRHIRKSGGDAKEGEVVVEKGRRLTSSRIGLLAALGISRVGVARKPSASFVATGSELVDIAGVPKPGQILNSSAFMIPAMLRESGADSGNSVTVPDDPVQLEKAFRAAFESDLLVSTGGVSVGKYDLVLKTLENLGVDIKFWQLNVKPGKPFAFGTSPNGMPVFCLPGNPVSSAVTFHKLVRPAIAAMMGETGEGTAHFQAVLEQDVEKKDTRVHFVRGIIRRTGGRTSVRTTGGQASNMLTSIANANCLIVLPEEARTYKAGETVEVELL